jgi:hypothetical protein
MAVETVRRTDIQEPEDRREQAYLALDRVLEETPLGSTKGLAFYEQVELQRRIIVRAQAQSKLLVVEGTKDTSLERKAVKDATEDLARIRMRIRFNSTPNVLDGYDEARNQFAGLISSIRQAELAVSPTRERTFLEFGLIQKAEPYRSAIGASPSLRRLSPKAA